MKWIDLSHTIQENMPVFPGTEPPILLQANTVARDHFAEKKITLYSHTGTHMDAPAHMLENARTLDAYAIGSFFGKAVLVDASRDPAPYIELSTLLPLQNQFKNAQFCILRTGWAERWGQPDYFEGFPALTPAAAHWLVDLGIQGIGTDAISIDRMQDAAFPVHHILFQAGVFIIENLTNLDKVGTEFTLACFPLRILNADGSPVRAAAWVED